MNKSFRSLSQVDVNTISRRQRSGFHFGLQDEETRVAGPGISDFQVPRGPLFTTGHAQRCDEEREGISNLFAEGFLDTFRHLYPDKTGAYSWWSYRAGARARNVGWRIDYFVVSDDLATSVREASILPDIEGSDHCPVTLSLTLA